MNTDSLIDMLSRSSADSTPPRQRWQPLALLASSAAVTVGLTLWLFRLNPNLFDAAQNPWFWLRFSFLASLGLLAWACIQQLKNPAAASKAPLLKLGLPSAVLAGIATWSLLAAEPQARTDMLLGTTWKVCSLSIAFLAVPMFVGATVLMRQFAPTRLRTTGAVLGLFSGAVAALIYTLHCPELHPAFLVVWYGLGVLIPTAVGWLVGERLLRW